MKHPIRIPQALVALAAVFALTMTMSPTAQADPTDPPTSGPTATMPQDQTPTPDPTAAPSDDPTPTDPTTTPSDDPSPSVDPEPSDTPTSPSDTPTSPSGESSEPTPAPSASPTESPTPEVPDSSETHGLGFVSPMINMDPINNGDYTSGAPGQYNAATLPAAYDLRSAHPTWVNTSVRDQGYWGVCWAFAASASAEAGLVRNGVISPNPNTAANQVSPLQLTQAVFASGTFPSTPGANPISSSQSPYQLGGNALLSAAAWSHWRGAQKESVCPYPSLAAQSSVPNPACNVAQGTSSAYHLINAWLLPDPNPSGSHSAANVTAIKNAVYTYGTATIAFDASQLGKSPYYRTIGSTNSYSSPSSKSNHEVALIGWDDNYAASNFYLTPAGPGAFLVKNQWGSTAQYFYLSYYDKSVSDLAIFNMISSAPSTTANLKATDWTIQYEYDDLGWFGGGFGTTNLPSVSFANVFTATSTAQALRAVQFVTMDPNTSYSVSVYKKPTSGPVTGGTMAAVGASGALSKTGSATYAGYQTVTFDTPVVLAAGEKFSVVVTEKIASGTAYAPVETRFTNSANQSSAATVYSGQSFLLTGSTWTDMVSVASSYSAGTVGNLNLIAEASPVPTPTVTLNPNGGSVSPTSLKVTYGSTFGTLPTPTRTGYTFNGWFTATTGGTKYTSASVVSLLANTTLYAQWTANKYTVTFNVNGGGTASPTTKSVTYDSTYGTLATVSRPAPYHFLGWFTAASGGSAVTAATAVKITANQTLYAHWDQISGSVTVSPSAATAAVGTTLTASAGTWTPSPVTLAYQWLRDGVAISGATATTYKLTPDDAGHKITVRVTGSKSGYPSVVKTSTAVTATQLVTGITMSPTAANVGATGKLQLTATIAPTYATNKSLTWTSSDTSLAVVDSTGLVTGKYAGTVTITATAKDGSGRSATATIKVLSTCTTFSDVPRPDVYAPYICWMSAKKVTSGTPDGRYLPAQPVEREQMAVFMYQLAGAPAFTPPTKPSFTDVPASSQYYKFIEWMRAKGITSASATVFNPTQPVTREQMAVFMYQLSGSPSYTPPTKQSFSDVPPTSQYYKFIEWMKAKGITSGTAGGATYSPTDSVTRAQMAVFMYQLSNLRLYCTAYPKGVGC
ncbi:MAG: S-layer homology domain-containing protein [Propionibacteriaceae bacterium]|nr:S-layer homology domain-containing protein [Propionibacteriaceae bacterium]